MDGRRRQLPGAQGAFHEIWRGASQEQRADARDHAVLSEDRRDDAYDRQSSSHLAISMVGGTETTLEPLYLMREMLEDMKRDTAFGDAQNPVFHT